MRDPLWRCVPALAGAVVYCLLAVLLLRAPGIFYNFLNLDGTIANTAPFGDLGAILQAGVCWRHGVNVYAHNACMGGGVYNYSPSLLWAAYLPIGPQDCIAGGLLLGALFLAATCLLPSPRSAAELAFRTLALCSSTVVWALEEANFDICVFILVMLGLALLIRHSRAALAGYLLFLVAASAKFYPAVLLALAWRERLAILLGLATLLCVAGIFYLLHFAHGAEAAMRIVPGGPPFSYVFGAMNIPVGITLLWFGPADAQHALFIALATRVLVFAAIITSIFTVPRYEISFAALAPARSLPLAAGSLLIAFCFCVAQNLDYRGIFLLLTLPGLWEMARQSTGTLRRRIFTLHGISVFLMWEPFCRHVFGVSTSAILGVQLATFPRMLYWLFREGCWWWAVIQFCALILCFLRNGLRMQRAEIMAWLG